MEDRTSHGKRVSESPFFKKVTAKAENYVKTPGRVTHLLNDAYQKAAQQKDIGEIAGDVWDTLQRLFRMIKAAISGQYHGIPNRSVIGAVAVLLYFLSPIDFVPDFIPVVGLLDDMALVAWFMTTIKTELEHFDQWEQSQGASVGNNLAMERQQNYQTGSPVKDHGHQEGYTQTSGLRTGADQPKDQRMNQDQQKNQSQGGNENRNTPDKANKQGAQQSQDVNSPQAAAQIANSHDTYKGAEYRREGRENDQRDAQQKTDYPGSAGEMRKDVKGEAKDETHRIEDHSRPGDQSIGEARSAASNTGNVGSTDESHGTGKNLGDSSRTAKNTDNPNKDGAHNR